MQDCKVLLSSILTKEVIHPQPDSPFQVAQKSKTFNSPPFWQFQFCDNVCLDDEIIIIISLTYLLIFSMYREFILNHTQLEPLVSCIQISGHVFMAHQIVRVPSQVSSRPSISELSSSPWLQSAQAWHDLLSKLSWE